MEALENVTNIFPVYLFIYKILHVEMIRGDVFINNFWTKNWFLFNYSTDKIYGQYIRLSRQLHMIYNILYVKNST